jgi:hypothetical protein
MLCYRLRVGYSQSGFINSLNILVYNKILDTVRCLQPSEVNTDMTVNLSKNDSFVVGAAQLGTF